MPSQRSKSRTKNSHTRPAQSRARRITATRVASSRIQAHLAFVPLVILIFIVWLIYRTLFAFPIWFDETIGKAVFFALPVWAYVAISRFEAIPDSFSLAKLQPGMLLGLAVGGLYGFVATLTSLWVQHSQVQAAFLFSSNVFWWEFLLALFTGFWETLFFFSFIMTVIQATRKDWSLLWQVIVTAVIFVIFHMPNVLNLFSGPVVIVQLLLLFAFALGQGFLYSRNQNAYALVISHAIWGMVLLVHVV